MIRVIALLCEVGAPDVCLERVHAYVPRLPVACIFTAGPELDRLVPEGWEVVQWRCLTPTLAEGDG